MFLPHGQSPISAGGALSVRISSRKESREKPALRTAGPGGRFKIDEHNIPSDNFDAVPRKYNVVASAEQAEKLGLAENNYVNEPAVAGVNFNIADASEKDPAFNANHLLLAHVGYSAKQNTVTPLTSDLYIPPGTAARGKFRTDIRQYGASDPQPRSQTRNFRSILRHPS